MKKIDALKLFLVAEHEEAKLEIEKRKAKQREEMIQKKEEERNIAMFGRPSKIIVCMSRGVELGSFREAAVNDNLHIFCSFQKSSFGKSQMGLISSLFALSLGPISEIKHRFSFSSSQSRMSASRAFV